MMEGKAALITGSTSGLGKAIAQSLTATGCHVMLNGFGDPGEIEALRKGLENEHNVRVLYSPADMARPDEIEQMAGEALEAFGTVDVLVNNAGIQHVASVEEFPREKWDAIIAINLSSAFHTIRTLLPAMKTKGWGRIVNIASAHGLAASAYKSAYVSAKHGMVGLTKVVALETARQGITCNAICPGYVLTPLVEAQIEDQAKVHGIDRESVVRDVLLLKQPTKEFVKMEDVASLVLYLCSDAAAAITGASLSIDGGWMAE